MQSDTLALLGTTAPVPPVHHEIQQLMHEWTETLMLGRPGEVNTSSSYNSFIRIM